MGVGNTGPQDGAESAPRWPPFRLRCRTGGEDGVAPGHSPCHPAAGRAAGLQASGKPAVTLAPSVAGREKGMCVEVCSLNVAHMPDGNN